MSTDHEKVKEFQERFGVPVRDRPQQLPEDEADYRVKFMQEELGEFVLAYNEHDLVKQADALVDLAYVVHGTALMMGLPWEQLFNAVHAANMRKVPGSDRHRYDVVKLPGWTGPELELQRLLLDAQLGVKP